MPNATRAMQVDLEATPYYHCIARCVRRAYLCGDDPLTGENFDHRKGWFLERMKLAGEAFAIDVCAFAVMSNHFHTVLRVDKERALSWSDEAALRRYAKFFPLAARAVRELPKRQRAEQLVVLRERLSSISWFMRVLCEDVARRANAEDECTGRFWEGRFKSQALLDEAALYTCMGYVDLNPVRAGMASSLEGSTFTSIAQRLRDAAEQRGKKPKGRAGAGAIPVPLAPLRGESRAGSRPLIDFRFDDYVELLEWTGRAVGAKPGGRIRGAAPAALADLGIDAGAWLGAMQGSALAGVTSLGSDDAMAAEAARRGCRWLKGQRASVALFGRAG